MRTFVLKATQAPTSADLIDLDDLKGSGRVDLVARCVSNAIFVSNHKRLDTQVHVVMEGKPNATRVISFFGEKLNKFEYDERSISSVIKNALSVGESLGKDESVDVEPGVKISRMTFTDFMNSLDGEIYYLDKRGDDIRSVEFKSSVDNIFVFGDHKGLDKPIIRLLKRLKGKRICLSLNMIYSSHCIIIVHNELDIQKL